MRREMKPSKDARMFRNTATTTKKININPSIPRGGIRL